MSPIYWVALLLSFLSFTHGYLIINKPEYIHVAACTFPFTKVTYGTNISSITKPQLSQPQPALAVYCQYEPALGSVTVCLNQHASSEIVFAKSVDLFLSLNCPNVNRTHFYKAYNNATSYSLLNIHDLHTDNIVYDPVEITKDVYNAYYRAYHVLSKAWHWSNINGYIIISYWFAVLLISAMARFFRKTGIIMEVHTTLVKKLQKHFLLPNLFNSTHNQRLKVVKVISLLIPTRADGLVIVLYIVIHVVLMCFNWEFDHNNILFSDYKHQAAKFLAHRTGVLAFSHLPMIYLFAGRNNIMSFITGFPYSSYIQFHKWTGRLMFIDATIHSLCFTVMWQWDKSYTVSLSVPFIQYGVIGTIVAGLLMLQAYNWFRSHCYEIFLYGHIVLAVIFTSLCWCHCIDLGWMQFVYAAIAFWAFDRFVRLARIVNFGLPRATIKIVSNDTMKIVIPRPSKARWHAKPGQFIFAYFMLPTTFWQSHPFTVSDSTIKDGLVVLYVKRKSGVTDTLFRHASKTANANNFLISSIRVTIEGPYGESAPNAKYDNVMLFAGGNGIPGPFDHALKLSRELSGGGNDVGDEKGYLKNIQLIWVARDLASISWFATELLMLRDTTVQVTIFLTRETEKNLQAHRFENRFSVLEYNKNGFMINANNNIVSSSPKGNYKDEKTISYFHGKGLRLAPEFGFESEKERNVTIEISQSVIEDDSVFENFNSRGNIFATPPSQKQNNSNKSHTRNRSQQHPLYEQVGAQGQNTNQVSVLNAFKVVLGRPNLENIIKASFAEDLGSISISCCGPGIMCDQLRKVIAANLDQHHGRVDYFEESQIW